MGTTKKIKKNEAYELACIIHAGQKDNLNEDFIDYIIGINQCYVENNPKATDEEIIAVFLHSVIESKNIEKEMLKMLGVSETSINAILAITRKENEDIDTYIQRVSKNKIAKRILNATIDFNTNEERLNKLSENEKSKLVLKYTTYLEKLIKSENIDN